MNALGDMIRAIIMIIMTITKMILTLVEPVLLDFTPAQKLSVENSVLNRKKKDKNQLRKSLHSI